MNNEINDKFINIVLCIYDPTGNYAKHAAVVMTSIFMNTTSSIFIHIIHDNTLNTENYMRLQSTAYMYHQNIEFINVSNKVDLLFPDVDKFTGNFSRGTLFRLFIKELLPNINLVIYLDCDIIVHMDIKELLLNFSNQHPIAATLDYPRSNIDIYTIFKNRMRLDFKHYFCAGVCIIDLSKISNLPEKAANFFKQFNNSILLPDQDFLNYIFKNNWQQLDNKYNRFDIYSKGLSVKNILTNRNVIWHLGNKPWECATGLPTDILYWYYYNYSYYNDTIYETLFNTLLRTRKLKLPIGLNEWIRWSKGCFIWPFSVFKKKIKIIFKLVRSL